MATESQTDTKLGTLSRCSRFVDIYKSVESAKAKDVKEILVDVKLLSLIVCATRDADGKS